MFPKAKECSIDDMLFSDEDKGSIKEFQNDKKEENEWKQKEEENSNQDKENMNL